MLRTAIITTLPSSALYTAPCTIFVHVCIPTRAAGAQYSRVLSTFEMIKQIFGGSSKSGVLGGLNQLVVLASVRAG